MRQNSIKQILMISLTISISACSRSSQNQNSTPSNANSSKANASPVIPYSAPPATRASKDTPTAIEVTQVLKRANIFPKENAVRENPLTDLDTNEGVLTSVNIASSRVEGYTVKVYQSIDQCNQVDYG